MKQESFDTLATRALPENCLSDLTLDRLRCGELPASAAASAQQHLASCDRCRQRSLTLAAAADELDAELPPLGELLAPRAPAPVVVLAEARTRRGRWWAPALAVVSAAAAMGLFLGRQQPPEGEIRLKGASGELEIFVKRAGKVFRWQTEALHPGDQLRYSFRAPEPLHVMVLSREANGAVNRYFPADTRSFAVDMGVTLSKVATELDATLGNETLWGVFCRQPFHADGLLQQLEQTGAITPTEGCATQRLEFTKEAP